ncbi:ABC transporter substrate-binding protein [Pantanalinema rosaneae CENA516]|uniref:bifunctional serine/threonine-protein kinase/ABC transporter substrate-binding protein n=1 Tax=Pantanalinema rosaneae TaxID=1620701 RepID=UPI003D6EAF8D
MIGELIGRRYRVIGVLGAGGFGHTYVAEDTQRPGNPRCVLKHLTFVSNNPAVLQQVRRLFQVEAETLEQLGKHDQIPRLLAYFEEDEQFYLVQEFIEGHPLSEELKDGQRFSEAQVVALLEDALGILAFVHAQNVIHRDIKPDNLIRRQQDGKLVLIDFGAVKNIGNTVAVSTGDTALSVPIYTSGYGASEQCMGQPRFNSDIYSLGMLAIQALTGLRPSQLPQDYSTSEVLWHDRVEVSAALTQVIDKMVRYHFAQRFQSVHDVLDALLQAKLGSQTVLSPSRAVDSGKSATYSETAFRPLSNPIPEYVAPVTKPQVKPSRKTVTRIGGAILGTLAIALLVKVLSPDFTPEPQPSSTPSTLDRISWGESLLNKWHLNPQNASKQRGISQIAASNYEQAAKTLEAAHKADPSDPETLIYLNNARIGQAKSYTIAVAVPLGNTLNAALELLRGVAQAQDEVNRAGGIQGVPLRVAIANDDNDPAAAEAVAKTLANNPEVLGVVGHGISDTALAAAEIYQANQLVMVSPSSSAVTLSNFGSYIFRTIPSDSFTAKALGRYMLNQLHKKRAIVFFNSASAYSTSLKDEFKQALFYNAAELVDEIDLSRPDFDPAESINRALSERADVIMLASDSDVSDRAIQVIALNQRRLPILAGDSLSISKTLKVAREEAVGMVLATPTNLIGSAFQQQATQFWGSPDTISWRTALSYDAAKALIAAISREPTREGVQRSLTQPDFSAPGATGEVKFTPSGDRQGQVQLVTIVPVNTRQQKTYAIKPIPR